MSGGWFFDEFDVEAAPAASGQSAERYAYEMALLSRGGLTESVVALHACDRAGRCTECAVQDWPCRTVDTVARHHGAKYGRAAS